MNTPGFTAGSSLCKTRGNYPSAVPQSYSSAQQRVVSQMRPDGFGRPDEPSFVWCHPYGQGLFCCTWCYFEFCGVHCWRVGQIDPPTFKSL